jgi:formate dehydrogenase subunit delta
MNNVAHLVAMANDIAAFFAAETNHDVAVAGVANHIEKFWTPRMHQKLTANLDACGEDLAPLAREAIKRLTARETG